MSTEYISIEQVAEAYSVDIETVRRWCRQGGIQGAIHAGRRWRVPARYGTGSVEINIPPKKKESDVWRSTVVTEKARAS